MKKVLILIIISISILVSCTNSLTKESNSNNIENNTSNPNKKTKNNPTTHDTTTEEKSSNYSSNVNNNKETYKTNINSNVENMLKSIKNKALNKEVINSDFKLGESIDIVISKLGKPSSESYISSAKGDYFTFNSKNLSFGCNKGNEIFEIRSLDRKLNSLTLSDIRYFFGIPNYNIKTKSQERIIGYKLTAKIKILFVFDLDTDVLKHYSVLYPNLTKNSMSGDPGRSW